MSIESKIIPESSQFIQQVTKEGASEDFCGFGHTIRSLANEFKSWGLLTKTEDGQREKMRLAIMAKIIHEGPKLIPPLEKFGLEINLEDKEKAIKAYFQRIEGKQPLIPEGKNILVHGVHARCLVENCRWSSSPGFVLVDQDEGIIQNNYNVPQWCLYHHENTRPKKDSGQTLARPATSQHNIFALYHLDEKVGHLSISSSGIIGLLNLPKNNS